MRLNNRRLRTTARVCRTLTEALAYLTANKSELGAELSTPIPRGSRRSSRTPSIQSNYNQLAPRGSILVGNTVLGDLNASGGGSGAVQYEELDLGKQVPLHDDESNMPYDQISRPLSITVPPDGYSTLTGVASASRRASTAASSDSYSTLTGVASASRRASTGAPPDSYNTLTGVTSALGGSQPDHYSHLDHTPPIEEAHTTARADTSDRVRLKSQRAGRGEAEAETSSTTSSEYAAAIHRSKSTGAVEDANAQTITNQRTPTPAASSQSVTLGTLSPLAAQPDRQLAPLHSNGTLPDGTPGNANASGSSVPISGLWRENKHYNLVGQKEAGGDGSLFYMEMNASASLQSQSVPSGAPTRESNAVPDNKLGAASSIIHNKPHAAATSSGCSCLLQ